VRILPTKIHKYGYCFTQINRINNIAIYKQTKSSFKHFKAWEVIKIKSHDGYELVGIPFEPAEMYPRSNRWGTDGWTYTVYEDALKKFNQLVARSRKKSKLA